MRDILYVAIGGALGALARHGIGFAAGQFLGKGFPWGTLIANVAGCFLMGIVLVLLADFQARDAHVQHTFWYKAVAIGFLGGLTTFSSFGADTIKEFQGSQPTIDRPCQHRRELIAVPSCRLVRNGADGGD